MKDLNPRKKPKQKRAEETIEALLKATEILLSRDPDTPLTTTRICEVAGVAVGSFYQYFPNLEALLGQYIDRHIDRATEIIQAKMDELKSSPLNTRIRETLRVLIHFHSSSGSIESTVLKQIPKLERLERLRGAQRHFMKQFESDLLENSAHLRPKDATMASFLVVFAVEAIVDAAVTERPEYLKRAEFLEELVALVQNYLFEPELITEHIG